MKARFTSALFGLGLALASLQPAQAQTPAQAASQPIKFALCYDISKASVTISLPESQAVRDYAQLLNLSGGIEGHPIEIMLEDHGNEPQRGIECYEKMKRAGAITFDFLSTPITKALIPRLMKDENVLMSSFIGRSDAINGEVFKWIFPIGPTYWAQAANAIHYIKTQSKNNLKGVKVAFLYADFAFGQEPIPMLKTLAALEGFDLQLFPYAMPGSDQSSAFTQIRHFNPDWVINWGFTGMHEAAAREMKRNAIPMDKYIAVSWISELNIANIGNDAAKGLKRITSMVAGQESPLIQQIIKELYGKGKGNGPRETVNNVIYNTGLAVYSPVFEGARLAIKQYGWPITPDKMRRGLESIRNYDANGLIAPVTVTAKDHGGGGKTRIDMWDGTKYVPQTDWFSAYGDVVAEIVRKESAEYAKTNP